MSKSILQRFKGWMKSAGQWIKSHPYKTAALAAVFSGIISPLVVHFLLLYISNSFAEPDVTVDGDFGSGYPGSTVYPVATVYNAGDVTVERCHVEVTDMETHKGFRGRTIFSIAPDQSHIEQLEFQAPELPKGEPSDIRQYRIRAVCDNAVSPDSYSIMDVY